MRCIKLLLMGMTVFAGMFLDCEADSPLGIAWQSNVETGSQNSRETQQPVLLYFTTDYCTYCRKLERDVWSSPAVSQQISENFIPVKVNASRDRFAAQKHGIRAYPTIVIVSPDGKELGRYVGYTSATTMQQRLSGALSKLVQPVVMQ
ncbi:MAG: thioredoxin family protein [Planctomycetaceae bacterium]|nr:thioredoxin family protein [Planctomycetaceae bacterium]